MNSSNSVRIIPFMLLFVLITNFFYSHSVYAKKRKAVKFNDVPTTLLLGQEQSSKIEIKLPLLSTDIQIEAVYGKIKNIKQIKPRLVSATYIPPEQFFPAVDVITVKILTSNDDVIYAHSNVKLVGQGVATIKTTPSSVANIKIGSKSFGPVTADEHGVANVKVQVPPGHIFGLDDSGEKVELGVVEQPNGALFYFNQSEQDENTDPIKATLLICLHSNKGNRPFKTKTPLIETDVGTIFEAVKVGRAMYQAEYLLESRDEIQSINFEITFEDGPVLKKEISIKNDFSNSNIASIEPPPVEDVEKEDIPAIQDKQYNKLRGFASIKGGFKSNFDRWNSGVLKLDAGYGYFVGKDLIGFGFSSSFYRSTNRDTVRNIQGDITIKSFNTVIPLEVMAWYRLNISQKFAMYADLKIGGAIMITGANYNQSVGDIHSQSESGFEFATGAAIAGEFFIGKGAIVVEMGIDIINSNMRLFDGSLVTADFIGGYRFLFL